MYEYTENLISPMGIIPLSNISREKRKEWAGKKLEEE